MIPPRSMPAVHHPCPPFQRQDLKQPPSATRAIMRCLMSLRLPITLIPVPAQHPVPVAPLAPLACRRCAGGGHDCCGRSGQLCLWPGRRQPAGEAPAPFVCQLSSFAEGPREGRESRTAYAAAAGALLPPRTRLFAISLRQRAQPSHTSPLPLHKKASSPAQQPSPCPLPRPLTPFITILSPCSLWTSPSCSSTAPPPSRPTTAWSSWTAWLQVGLVLACKATRVGLLGEQPPPGSRNRPHQIKSGVGGKQRGCRTAFECVP